jgi:hypothetical protein
MRSGYLLWRSDGPDFVKPKYPFFRRQVSASQAYGTDCRSKRLSTLTVGCDAWRISKMRPFDIFLGSVLLLALAGCAQINDAVQDLRRANPDSSINDPAAESRRAAMEPTCWWDQPYQTVCERARAGGGQVCRPVPVGQPAMRCVGSSPQFPYSQNRR